jgi:hypothetical protein
MGFLAACCAIGSVPVAVIAASRPYKNTEFQCFNFHIKLDSFI